MRTLVTVVQEGCSLWCSSGRTNHLHYVHHLLAANGYVQWGSQDTCQLLSEPPLIVWSTHEPHAFLAIHKGGGGTNTADLPPRVAQSSSSMVNKLSRELADKAAGYETTLAR
jgi:hypothetical protein